MKELGGYFELEISNRGTLFHDAALAFNTCRNALEHILLTNKCKHIFVPYFTCDVILQPIIKNQINYTFYSIDENLVPILPELSEKDAVLYTNYFGITNEIAKELSKKNILLIVDNAQGFFDNPIEGVNTIYSPRKFFGLPDGGFAYCKHEQINYPIDSSRNRIEHMLIRLETGAEEGYKAFKSNEELLHNQPIKQMSKLTKMLMMGLDFNKIKQKRVDNFNFIHGALKGQNKFKKLIDDATISCPMVYPFWVADGAKLRKKLIQNKIFIAQYWPNVLTWTEPNSLEHELATNLVAIPIDQRYSNSELELILKIING